MAVKFTTPWMGGGSQQANEAVTVRNSADTANATVYTDESGDTTASNPVNTDANGLLTMFLNPGRYVLKSTNDRSEITVSDPGNQPTPPPPVGTADAADVTYDNSDGDLTATDVKAALDELAGRVAALETP